MAEFFAECIRKIRIRLGPTDSELKTALNYLNPITRQCVIDDAFGRLGTTFIIAKGKIYSPFFLFKLIVFKNIHCSILFTMKFFSSIFNFFL